MGRHKSLVKAVFMDRDGILNPTWGKDVYDNPESPLLFEDFRIFPYVGKTVRDINRLGFLAIVATNQPAYAKGKMSRHDLIKMHLTLFKEAAKAGGKIERIYTCLHHPDPNQVKIKNLLADCECRKPKPGMLLKAARDFGIALERSWMIGDSWRDVLAGEASGCKTILVSASTELLKKCRPDFIAEDLREAVRIIMREVKK